VHLSKPEWLLIVGGVAIAAHGCRDIANVDDLDLLIEPTVENGQKLLVALAVAQVSSIVIGVRSTTVASISGVVQ